jgi:hypothetical protein
MVNAAIRSALPPPTPKRPAREGEICPCGEPAIDVLLYEDLGPVPWCGTKADNHRFSDCPPWCTGEHSLPLDLRHQGESHVVPLDDCPQHERIDGQWQTWFLPLLIGITKEFGPKPAYIELIGTDDQLAGRLNAYEAEQTAEILLELAATLRASSPPPAPIPARQDEKPSPPTHPFDDHTPS